MGEGRALALKSLRGEPVLRDLVREHFLGCHLVLVHGGGDLPKLTVNGDRWSVEATAGTRLRFGLAELVALLSKPRPPWLKGGAD